MEMRKTEYLGDGVYAVHDGFGIWLHANHHEFPPDRIYLEPDVLAALNRFAEWHAKAGEEEAMEEKDKGEKSKILKHPAEDFLIATKEERASRSAKMPAMISIPDFERERLAKQKLSQSPDPDQEETET
jgi:hypothetical protein